MQGIGFWAFKAVYYFSTALAVGKRRASIDTASERASQHMEARPAIQQQRCQRLPHALALAGLVIGMMLASAGVDARTQQQGWREVFAGLEHSCGLEIDRSVTCWGRNYQGQAPRHVAGKYIQVAGGLFHTCAIRESDGTVECWGGNRYGQTDPVPAGKFTQIAATQWTTCGVQAGGELACWGRMAPPSEETRSDRDALPLPPDGEFTQVSVSKTLSSPYACAIKKGGQLACWGRIGGKHGPMPPANTEGTYKDIAVGSGFTCALKTDGTPVCWASQRMLDRMPTGKFEEIGAGYHAACAIKAEDGELSCWHWYHLDSTEEPNAWTPPAGAFEQVSLGSLHACGVQADSTLQCWGWNAHGQASPGNPIGVVQTDGTRSVYHSSDGEISLYANEKWCYDLRSEIRDVQILDNELMTRFTGETGLWLQTNIDDRVSDCGQENNPYSGWKRIAGGDYAFDSFVWDGPRMAFLEGTTLSLANGIERGKVVRYDGFRNNVKDVSLYGNCAAVLFGNDELWEQTNVNTRIKNQHIDSDRYVGWWQVAKHVDALIGTEEGKILYVASGASGEATSACSN